MPHVRLVPTIHWKIFQLLIFADVSWQDVDSLQSKNHHFQKMIGLHGQVGSMPPYP